MNACSGSKDGMAGPSRIALPVLVLPAWERAYEAALAEDVLSLGARICPVDTTDVRVRRGGWTAGYPRAEYELAPGRVVAVAPGSGRVPHRAYVAGEDGVAEISFAEAEDRIDAAGAGRRAWRRRIARARLTEKPRRHHMTAGHGYEAETVCDWGGEEYVAAITKAGPAYVWARAVTYAEAVELGVA